MTHLHRQITVITALLMASALTALVACGYNSAPSPGPGTPTPAPVVLRVVTTIYPVTYFSERIGGDRISVKSLIRPGVEAHDFEPTPGDIRDISRADVLVYIDPNFETWVADAVRSLGDTPIVVKTGDGSAVAADDPHIWLNPVKAIDQVRRIEAAFTTADPEGAATYKANADKVVSELTELDRAFSASLGSCTLDHIVVSHEAYGHMVSGYGIEQIALAGLSAEFESTPQRIAEVIKEMEERGITHILQEPILSDSLATTVAAETGAELLPLHPLESSTSTQSDAGETYFTVMRQNLESLKTALHCT